MPRHKKAMKDVVSCENLRRGAHNLRPVGVRMGQPGSGNAESSWFTGKRTKGSETSKYLQEEKTK